MSSSDHLRTSLGRIDPRAEWPRGLSSPPIEGYGYRIRVTTAGHILRKL